jgi:hypothetical protein
MDTLDRFIEMLKRSVYKLPEGVQHEFSAMLTTTNVEIMAGTLVVWAGSHAFGIGFIADILMGAAGIILMGWQVWQAASDLKVCITKTVSARSSADLDIAATHFARFVTTVGVTLVLAILVKRVGNVTKGARTAAATKASEFLGGMTKKHFAAFSEAAKETEMIIGVRNTNPLSTRWIERGFPPKPMSIKIKTSKTTGIVTAVGEAEVQEARKAGYFIVDAKGVLRNSFGNEIKLPTRPDWPLEPGQVVHPQQLKPVVGDYDLLGVIDPRAPGRNIALAASDGKVLDDWSNPLIKKAAAAVNRRLDQARVMHGAHDMYRKGMPDFSDLKDGATIFYPDGTTKSLSTVDEIRAFYEAMKRQTITGSY